MHDQLEWPLGLAGAYSQVENFSKIYPFDFPKVQVQDANSKIEAT